MNNVSHDPSRSPRVSEHNQDTEAVTLNGDAVPSYATVTSRHTTGISTAVHQSRSLSDAVLSAIYKEQYSKDRRSKTVVVSGFTSSSVGSDRDRFRELCSTELDINPHITHVSRLGASQGRVRPLLVAVLTAEEAAKLVERSRLVNRAASDGMRNIYINPNLRKAESKAAYEERWRRRSAAQRREGLRQSSSGQQVGTINNAHNRDAGVSEAAAVATSSLNPTASQFSLVGSHTAGHSE